MVVSDLQPALITHRISDDMPLTAKKGACVKYATEKCQISYMKGVRLWAQFVLFPTEVGLIILINRRINSNLRVF